MQLRVVFLFIFSFILILGLSPVVLADEIQPPNIRKTGLYKTIDIVTLLDDQEISYDLNLSKNQQAKVRLEILDPEYYDPERKETFYLAGQLIDYNVFTINGFVSFDLSNGQYKMYKLNGDPKTKVGDTLLQFRRMTNRDSAGYQIPENTFTAGNSEGRIDEFYIKKNSNSTSDEKTYLKFSSIWGYTTIYKHPPETANKFKFKVTIEKTNVGLLALRCKYLRFLYRNGNCTVSNENVIVNSSTETLDSTIKSSDKTIDNTRKNLDISASKYAGLPIEQAALKSGRVTQLPNGNFSHKGTSSIDIILPDQTPLFATIDGTATITTNAKKNTYPFLDKNGNYLKYYHDGKEYFKCMESDVDYDKKICKPNYGINIKIENNKNPNERYKVVYAHLHPSTYESLKDKNITTFEVKKGDLIGFSDNTGYSTNSHLHYEVWMNNKPILLDTFDYNGCKITANQLSNSSEKNQQLNACEMQKNHSDSVNLQGMGIEMSEIKK